jgi:hypothetical protein
MEGLPLGRPVRASKDSEIVGVFEALKGFDALEAFEL